MTRSTFFSPLSHATALLTSLSLLPSAQAFTCYGSNCADDTVRNVSLIYGLAFGIAGVLTILSLVFVCWRRNRIRKFQRNFVRDAEARAAAAQNQQTSGYPSSMSPQYSQHAPAVPQQAYYPYGQPPQTGQLGATGGTTGY